ncbi:hypothetical protein [Lyngbya sp. CCY1209]|jgi:hypothetical protein|nr:hypothetical protein [Lyngbya sp. CCY1209]MEB3884426.1 hypothetical protein [Lyngbya sp. CCY1209]
MCDRPEFAGSWGVISNVIGLTVFDPKRAAIAREMKIGAKIDRFSRFVPL